jgi:hypothetical protein
MGARAEVYTDSRLVELFLFDLVGASEVRSLGAVTVVVQRGAKEAP